VGTTSALAVTFLLITSKGRLDVEEVLVFFPTNTTPQFRTIPRNVDRVIIKLDGTPNSTSLVKITQGSQRFELTIDGHDEHGEAVFDVVP
jgi:hypothetical protein